MKYLIIWLLLLGGPLIGTAQPGVKGKVAGTATGNAIPYATVTVRNHDNKVTASCATDTKGSFILLTLKAGTYRIVFTAMGYAADSLTISVKNELLDLGTIKLSEGQQMGQIVVAARPLITLLSDRLVYDVEADPDAKRMKMTDMIGKIPLIRSNPGDGKLRYGADPVGQVLIDGEQHEMINARLQFPMALIRADVMSRIEVIPPGSP